jgi:hypothetical protein
MYNLFGNATDELFASGLMLRKYAWSVFGIRSDVVVTLPWVITGVA